jgi:ATP:ADP antiporter, AAA family
VARLTRTSSLELEASKGPGAVARRSFGERLLSVSSRVHAGEVWSLLLFAANGMLLMAAYYILKTAREPLILQGGGVARIDGDELKTYATAAQAVLLMGIVPLYSHFVGRTTRLRLITGTGAALAGSVMVFAALGHAQVAIGIPYYLWLGVASLVVVAQFWSYATDFYTREQGERLFPLIAAGVTLGAILGAAVARSLLARVGLMQLLVLSAGLLLVYAALMASIDRVGRSAPDTDSTTRAPRPDQLRGAGGFTLVRRSKYLLLIGVSTLVATLVNTHGEYILAGAVTDRAEQVVPAPGPAHTLSEAEWQAVTAQRRVAIGETYATFYGAVNAIAFLLQVLVVSRLFRHAGIHRALFVFPLVALAAYGSMAALPAFLLIMGAKTLENSADYSLHNTVRHTLFLPTSREAKYKAKAAIDSFFLRSGDLVAAGTVFAGVHLLGLSTRGFALVNVAIIAGWLPVVAFLSRRYRELCVGCR